MLKSVYVSGKLRSTCEHTSEAEQFFFSSRALVACLLYRQKPSEQIGAALASIP